MDEPDNASYLPTPAEIEAKCLEIQASWSDAERKSRKKVSPWKLDARGAEIERAARQSLELRLSQRRDAAR